MATTRAATTIAPSAQRESARALMASANATNTANQTSALSFMECGAPSAEETPPQEEQEDGDDDRDADAVLQPARASVAEPGADVGKSRHASSMGARGWAVKRRPSDGMTQDGRSRL